MLMPVMTSRMKKRYLAARRRIDRMSFVGFVTIASLAGQRHVVFIAGTAFAPWHDVF
jgi:hypothetical protein